MLVWLKILAKESIFNMSNYLTARPNVDVAFEKLKKIDYSVWDGTVYQYV